MQERNGAGDGSLVASGRKDSAASGADPRPPRALEASFAVFTAGPEGRFVSRQSDWERYTGQPWEKHRDHGWLDVVHPGDREALRALLAAPPAEPVVAFEGRVRRVQQEGWRKFVARAIPVRDEQGAVTQWSGSIVDVEETWAPQRRLRALGARLRAILDYSPAVVFIKDLEGRYVLASRSCCDVMGISPEALIGRTDADVWADVAEELSANDRQVIQRGVVVEAEELVRTPHGDRTFLSTKFPLRDPDGEISGVAGIATDVTDRRRALEQVRVEVERRDQFLAMLSHELRNPVHAAQGAMAVARDCCDDGAREPLEVIERQLAYLASILEDLLEVTRVTQGKISMRFEDVDLRAAVRHGVEMTAQLAERHGVTVESDLPEEPLAVRADLARLAQIVGNLLNNAIRFSSPSQTVDVRAWRDGGKCWVEVRDRGVGLSDDDHRGMFELFYQGQSTIDRSRGGLGVGLTLVQTIVEQHGGHIEAEGAPDQGATFRVAFHASDAPRESLAQPAEDRGPTSDAPLRLFLVEDNEDARTMLRLALRRRGHEVDEADTGEAGLEGIRRTRPDVAIVDIGLPGLDGYEVARRVRSDEALAEVKLVALTGYGRAEDRRAALEAGFDAHLTKPVAPRELHRILGELRTTK